MKKNHTSRRALFTGRCQKGRRGSLYVCPLPDERAGRLLLDEGDLCLFDGDTVQYRVLRRRGRIVAEAVQVESRARETFVAALRRRQGLWYLEPRDGALGDMIRLQYLPEGAQEGLMALCRVVRWPSRGADMEARVEALLGGEEETGAMLAGIAAQHGFLREYPKEAQPDRAELLALPDEPREDLRDLVTFTIDGDDAQDFDDAVSLTWRDGRAILGVHIADVSHYVREDTPLDGEARARGTSLYLPHYTVPMLPEVLCNDLCSLRPGEDRRAMTLLTDMETGETKLFPSLIRSRARLTYRQVNRFFGGEEDAVPEEVRTPLKDMLRLSRRLRAQREARGSVDFDLPEIEFDFDENGVPVAFRPRERGEGERLIEDFMLLANEKVAAMARENELRFAYRVHEPPEGEKLAQFVSLLTALNMKSRIGPESPAKELQKVLKEAEERGLSDAVAPSLLRCMQRARYDSHPLGHYALALADYCHFTSPIRRYPDLLVHRALKRMLQGRDKLPLNMGEECLLASQREYEAAQAEREGDDLCACLALRGREGERFEGVLSGVSRGACFVRLTGGAEGCVPYRLMDRPARSDEHLCRVLLPDGGCLTLGDPVAVELVRVDVDLREITLAFSTDEPPRGPRKDKPARNVRPEPASRRYSREPRHRR